MINNMKTALVTGGCGFVGRHVTLKLLSEGYRVWMVDDLSTGRSPQTWIPGADKWEELAPSVTVSLPDRAVTFIQTDVRNFFRQAVESDGGRTFEGIDLMPETFDKAFHFAAVVGGRTKIEGDPLAVALDLAIDAEFFSWAVKARPEKILFASSSAAYPINLQGEEGAIALKESDVDFEGTLGVPDMTYGWSKLTGEFLSRIAAKSYGLSIACVRPFSGYGEDQEPEYPIPAIAGRAARQEDPLTIWGSGHQGRDFVHIDDCVDAMFLAIEKISDGSAVNIGSGRLTTFLEVAKTYAHLAGYSPEIVALADKPTGVHARYADIQLSRELLGWEPRISLEEGLGRVLAKAIENEKTVGVSLPV